MFPITYRLITTLAKPILMGTTGACLLSLAVASAQQPAASSSTQITNQAVADATKNQSSDLAQRQTASAASMLPGLDKQKTAIQKQIGTGGPGDAFFSSSWSTPATIPVPAVAATCEAMTEDEMKPIIAASATAEGMKPEVIRAVIRRESAAYPCAVSEKGALGMMQLMPDVAQQFNVDPLDAKQNIQGGTKYLKQLMTRYKGDLRLALAAYNAGPQRVDAINNVPAIPETTAYVNAILDDLKTKSVPRPN